MSDQSIDSASILSERDFARTYAPPSHDDAWALVEEYERVQEANAAHPSKKSAALSSIVDLPRSRIRTWIERDGKPDVVRGLQFGREREWFSADAAIINAWATLFAGVLGGGSISDEVTHVSWMATPLAAAQRITDALDALGVEYRRVDRDGHPTELRPTEGGSMLARALVALGAPHGSKTPDTVAPVPEWLQGADETTREAAVLTLVMYRGRGFQEKDTVQLFEARSRAYRESVAAFIQSIVDGEVSPGERWVTISAAAARELGVGRGGPLRGAIEAT